MHTQVIVGVAGGVSSLPGTAPRPSASSTMRRGGLKQALAAETSDERNENSGESIDEEDLG